MKIRTLITGITGSIGAHLAKALLERGDKVVGISHDKHPVGMTAPELLGISDKLAMAHGDILDLNFLKRVMSDYEIEIVFHLAALPIVRTSGVSPLPVWKTNIEGTWNVMEAARETGAKVVYLDSDKSYGHHGEIPYKEDFALNGLGIYDCSKGCAAKIVLSYHFVFDVPIAIVRSCNIYGPADLNSRLIPNSIRKALRGESPVIYDGINYMREWIYVTDIVRALIETALRIGDTNGTNGEVYNVGTGVVASQEEVIGEILKHFPGVKAEIRPPLPYMKYEIPYQALDSRKIRKEDIWQPEVTFEEGIARTVRWWKDNEKQVCASHV